MSEAPRRSTRLNKAQEDDSKGKSKAVDQDVEMEDSAAETAPKEKVLTGKELEALAIAGTVTGERSLLFCSPFFPTKLTRITVLLARILFLDLNSFRYQAALCSVHKVCQNTREPLRNPRFEIRQLSSQTSHCPHPRQDHCQPLQQR